jgi:tRNA(adenine34) deaminase
MDENQDIDLMRLAIKRALIGRATPGGAEVGAVLVASGKVLCEAFNEGESRHDATAHAEMVVIRRAGEILKKSDLRGYTLYCALQPCGMCTMACLWAGISRIVYGEGRQDVHHIYFESRHNDTVDFIQDAFRDDLEILGGVLRHECAGLYAGPDDPTPDPDPAHAQTKRPGRS